MKARNLCYQARTILTTIFLSRFRACLVNYAIYKFRLGLLIYYSVQGDILKTPQ